MRFLSIHLPFLPTDRVRRMERSDAEARDAGGKAPLALWAKIDGAQVITAADEAALARRLHPGLSVVVARGMCPTLRLLEGDGEADATLLATVTDWCRRFTPLAALDPPDGAILDVSGVAHLFGGEDGLLRAVEEALVRQGFHCRLSLAPTAAAAAAFARFGGPRLVRDEVANAKAVRALPGAALSLDGKAAGRLREAGLRTLGDLILRPRAPITARFGPGVWARIDAMLGAQHDPLSPRFEAPPYMAERRFAEGLTQRDVISATLRTLCGELCTTLARHEEGARSLCASFFRVDGAVRHVEAATSRPSRDIRGLMRLLDERLDAIGEQGLDTGYGFDLIRLAALAVEPLGGQQSTLNTLAQAGERPEDFTDLVDRLGARFGTRRVQRLDFLDTHWPERAVSARPAARGPADTEALTARGDSPHPAFSGRAKHDPGSGYARTPVRPPSVHEESPRECRDDPLLPTRPAKLFDQPEPIETMLAAVPDGPPTRFRWRRVEHDVVAFEGPERIASEWWKDPALTRDYFRVEDAQGSRFWLFREGLYFTETASPRWFLHGVFA